MPSYLPWMLRFACLSIAVLASGRAHAQVQVIESRLLPTDVRIQCRVLWPSGLEQGYVPLRFELNHQGSSPAEIEVKAVSGQRRREGSSYASRLVSMKPGERAQFEILMPSAWRGARRSSSPYVVVSSGKVREALSLPSRGSHTANSVVGCLIVGAEKPDAGTNQSLASMLDSASLAFATSATHGSAKPDIGFAVGALTFEDLPQRWQAYSSLDLVVLDSSDGQAMGRSLAPILSWVRLGGQLSLVGPMSIDALSRIPGLEDAFEGRRSIEGRSGCYSHGFGQIQVHAQAFEWQSGMKASATEFTRARALAELPGRWTPNASYWRLGDSTAPNPLSRVPVQGFLIALLAFAVFVGPIHLIALRRWGQPALMLLTIPLFSIVATSGILMYGILAQGVDLRVEEKSLSFLDQGSKRVSNLVRRDLFAGGFGGLGLRPAAGTAVFPIENWKRIDSPYQLERSETEFVLTGGFLPVRDQVEQWVASEKTSRYRLSVSTADGSTVEITNEGAVTIEELFYQSLEGAWYRAAKLEPGSSQVATPSSFEGSSLESHMLQSFGKDLPMAKGGYVARLAKDPFMDDLGLEWSPSGGRHFLIGVIETGDAQ